MISVLCATRGRPEIAKRMAHSALSTCKSPIEIIFGIDVDDPLAGEYPDEIASITVPDWGFAYKTHILAGHASGDMMMVCGDDAIFKTEGWDAAFEDVAAHYPDGIFCVNANDGLVKPGKVGYPHPCVGRRWFEVLGYVYHPMFYHFCGDRWTTDLAAKLGRLIHLKDVHIHHLRANQHPDVEKDDTYNRVRDRAVNTRDENCLFLARDYFAVDLEKLRAAMDAHPS